MWTFFHLHMKWGTEIVHFLFIFRMNQMIFFSLQIKKNCTQKQIKVTTPISTVLICSYFSGRISSMSVSYYTTAVPKHLIQTFSSVSHDLYYLEKNVIKEQF